MYLKEPAVATSLRNGIIEGLGPLRDRTWSVWRHDTPACGGDSRRPPRPVRRNGTAHRPRQIRDRRCPARLRDPTCRAARAGGSHTQGPHRTLEPHGELGPCRLLRLRSRLAPWPYRRRDCRDVGTILRLVHVARRLLKATPQEPSQSASCSSTIATTWSSKPCRGRCASSPSATHAPFVVSFVATRIASRRVYAVKFRTSYRSVSSCPVTSATLLDPDHLPRAASPSLGRSTA